ncbi:tetratricopeptide repeat protein [Clostridium sp. C8-1-8]|uniref:tetratricopeptide repeat protein n=1 Tax=Clostridium sp. C8-1-8 TaxID=2698831 RepID=UPI00136C9735|nr:tetratricopeptide repeat protein [Clostridium sp. C8-1-8]
MLRNGLRIRCLDEIESQLREIVLEFGKWIRGKLDFPVAVTVYIRSKYVSKVNNEEVFLASFFAPDSRTDNPYIRVDVENHKDNGVNEFRKSILVSISHEIIHYVQWLEELEFCEEDAENRSEQLVEKFIEDRGYNLTVTYRLIKLLQLADSKSSHGNFNEAISLYKDVIKTGCDDEYVYNSIAYYYDCIEKFNESIYYYDKALKINPNNYEIYTNKGYALYCSEEYNEAIESYDKSLNIEPTKETYVFKAYAEEELGNYTQAIGCYDEAIRLDANYDIAYNRKGQLLLHMGVIDDARQACSKAILINSEYADAYYNLSVICARLGDFGTATNYLKTAISIDEEYIHYAQDEEVFKDHEELIQRILLN